MYYVYILHSKIKGRYYIGCCKNMKRRLGEHNSGKVRSTKAHIPWEIVYTEEIESRTEAYEREKEIKSYKSGSRFQKLIKTESWQSG